jgi:2-polyprenyl-3-methyl-5-hydroxy-6-metoxy-1,4-benzoquinol methylase
MSTGSRKLVQIACNLCGRDDTRLRYQKAGLSIVECCRCGLTYVNPRWTQAEIWHRYGSAYFWEEYLPAQGAADGQVDMDLHDRQARPILDLARPYWQQGRLLDVGCAAGFFLKAAERSGWTEVLGVEIMQDAVDFARERLGLHVLQGTLEQANFGSDFFDVVTMLETIEHLLDPRSAVSEAYRILRPGGALILTTPNLGSLARRLFGVQWSVLGPGEHLYYFRAATLTHMLQEAGFRHIKFVWLKKSSSWLEIINPHHVDQPASLRCRLAQNLISLVGPMCYPAIAGLHLSDSLYALAEK